MFVGCHINDSWKVDDVAVSWYKNVFKLFFFCVKLRQSFRYSLSQFGLWLIKSS